MPLEYHNGTQKSIYAIYHIALLLLDEAKLHYQYSAYCPIFSTILQSDFAVALIVCFGVPEVPFAVD
ncbi:unnamed protein product [Meloidogyne enterolobii]|uniref:Uncharacterized protein n=1 Tax=Meloidogyne enterolobii TaxID=390850 RepID=A0ACB1AJJ3_MELEN